MHELSIYQILHTLSGRVFHLEAHLEAMCQSYRDIYNRDLNVNVERIREWILSLLSKRKGAVKVSVFVRLDLFADASLKISIVGNSIYSGYALRCIYPIAAIVDYDVPRMRDFTSAREAVAKLANVEVERAKGNIAIKGNRDNFVDIIDNVPIFGVKDRVVYTSYQVKSVEHTVVINALEGSRIEIVDRRIMESDLKLFDEIFYANHYGITAVSRFENQSYTSIVSKEVAEIMQRYSRKIQNP